MEKLEQIGEQLSELKRYVASIKYSLEEICQSPVQKNYLSGNLILQSYPYPYSCPSRHQQ